MRTIRNCIYYWLPPIVWMVCIFYMSSQQKVNISDQVVVEFVTFKTLHMIEYALLFFLFYRAFNSLKILNQITVLFLALTSSLLYSASDEFHQLFTPTRQGRMRDIVFDLVGMLIMYTIIRSVHYLKRLL